MKHCEFWTASCEKSVNIWEWNWKNCENNWRNLADFLNAERNRRASRNRKKGIFCSLYSFLQSRVLVAPSGHMLRITGIHFLYQSSPYSHCQRSELCAPSFRYSSRPRCFAAAWWFRLRSRELRPEDACQKRVSWFSDWSPKVQQRVNLVDLVKSFQTSIYYLVIICKSRRRYSRERTSRSLPKITKLAKS